MPFRPHLEHPPQHVNPSLRALLTGLIDYAGTFPPAKLDLPTAVQNFRRYSQGPNSWMLGKLVVPAVQLNSLPKEKYASPVAVSALLTSEPQREAEMVRDLRSETVSLQSVEVRLPTAALIPQIAAVLPEGIPVFCEISNLEKAEEWLGKLREANWAAKIRTGGITPDLFPSAAAISTFVAQCRQAGVAFKATAGLHHPVRSEHPLTYEPNSICGTMHGFLNVFVGASLLYTGASREQFAGILEDTNPSSFEFSGDAVSWRGLKVTTDKIRSARQNFAVSFGSCSFEEPVQDLQQLGFL